MYDRWDDKMVTSLDGYPLYINSDGACLFCCDRSVPLKEMSAEEKAHMDKVRTYYVRLFVVVLRFYITS
jgi:hypothetical protein